jgi:hypothetical protein
MESVFRVDRDRVTVSPHAAGPWDPTRQHGSAPASTLEVDVELPNELEPALAAAS